MSVESNIAESVKKMEGAGENLAAHDDTLKNITRYNLKERETLERLIQDLKKQAAEMTEFSGACDQMMASNDVLKKNLLKVKKEGIAHDEQMKLLQEVWMNSVRLKALFEGKKRIIKLFIKDFEELRTGIQDLHSEEMNQLKALLQQAEAEKDSLPANAFNNCNLILENVQILKGRELGEEGRKELEAIKSRALAIRKACLPKIRELINHFEKELIDGWDRTASDLPATIKTFDAIKRIAANMRNIPTDGADNDDIGRLKEFVKKLDEVEGLCSSLGQTFNLYIKIVQLRADTSKAAELAEIEKKLKAYIETSKDYAVNLKFDKLNQKLIDFETSIFKGKP
jgi:hypothetical protein